MFKYLCKRGCKDQGAEDTEEKGSLMSPTKLEQMGSKHRWQIGTEVEEGPPCHHHRRKGGKKTDPGRENI